MSKGLKYGIRSKKVNRFEILARSEALAQSLRRMETGANSNAEMTPIDLKPSFLKQLQASAMEFLELTKIAQDNLSGAEHQALNGLATDSSIVITRADKGNAVVIQDVTDYKKKIRELLVNSGQRLVNSLL